MMLLDKNVPPFFNNLLQSRSWTKDPQYSVITQNMTTFPVILYYEPE